MKGNKPQNKIESNGGHQGTLVQMNDACCTKNTPGYMAWGSFSRG